MNKKMHKLLAMTWLGGVIEFYDFIIFAYLATILGVVFFPGDDQFMTLLFGYAILAVGYIARPAGAILFGLLADWYGRKHVLVIAMTIMGLTSLAVSLLPAYASIGLLAPVTLVLLRLLQGIALSGEMASSTTLVAEYAAKERRGFWCSLLYTHTIVGTLLGSFVVLMLTTQLTQQQLVDWGWRIPFLLGSSLCLIAGYLRLYLHETPLFNQLKSQSKLENQPLRQLWRYYKMPVFCLFIIIAVSVSIYNVVFIVNPLQLQSFGYSSQQLMLVNTIALGVGSLSCVINGYLSDRFGRITILRAVVIFFIAGSLPLYFIMSQSHLFGLITGYLLFAYVCGALLSLSPLVINEHFPSAIRGSGASLVLNCGIALGGGITPILCISMAHAFGHTFATAFYLVLLAAMTAFVLPRLNEMSGIDLRNVMRK